MKEEEEEEKKERVNQHLKICQNLPKSAHHLAHLLSSSLICSKKNVRWKMVAAVERRENNKSTQTSGDLNSHYQMRSTY